MSTDPPSTDPLSTDAPATSVCYRHPNRESYVSCQRCGRTICPECQTVAPVGVQCPECVREGRASVAGPRVGNVARRFSATGTTPVVTYGIMAICAVLFLAQLAIPGVTSTLVLDPSAIASQPWRLITSAFLHSKSFIPHILLNLYALYIFGPALERFLGRARYLALYLVGALGGSVGMVLVYQANIATNGSIADVAGGLFAASYSLGASGAIFALMGALLVLRRAMGLQLMQILVVVVINLAFGFFARGVAWEAHVGGFITGLAIGLVYLNTRRTDHRARQVVLVATVAVVLAAICVACIVGSPAGYYR